MIWEGELRSLRVVVCFAIVKSTLQVLFLTRCCSSDVVSRRFVFNRCVREIL